MNTKPPYDDDDESFDPKKLFDSEQYNTLFIGREGFSKKQNTAADLVEKLFAPDLTRQEYEEILAGLKQHDARQMLVDALENARDEHKRVLVAACWESGLDFSGHFLFFCRLVINEPFAVGMEAFTVVSEMLSQPSDADVKQVLGEIRQSGERSSAMVNELEEFLTKKSQP